MSDHEHCWHLLEVLPDRTLSQRCCWCDSRRMTAYSPTEVDVHGRFIYR